MNRAHYREHRIPRRSDPQGSLARRVGEAPMERERIEEYARQAWRQHGTVTALPWQRLDEWERATLNAIGQRLYGPRQR